MNNMKSIRFLPPVADEMIRAILEGRKTVTRRVVKPRPVSKIAYVCMGYKRRTWGYPHRDAWKYWDDESFRLPDNLPDVEEYRLWTPPCHADDILYVWETWQHGFSSTYLYKADTACDLFMTPDRKLVSDIPWRPSTNMPREATRLFLRVTDVRAEGLQDITKEQALSEGVPDDSDYPPDNPCIAQSVKEKGL